MATILSLPRRRAALPRLPVGACPGPGRGATALALLAAGVLSVGISWGVTDAFVASSHGPSGYVAALSS